MLHVLKLILNISDNKYHATLHTNICTSGLIYFCPTLSFQDKNLTFIRKIVICIFKNAEFI